MKIKLLKSTVVDNKRVVLKEKRDDKKRVIGYEPIELDVPTKDAHYLCAIGKAEYSDKRDAPKPDLKADK